MSPVYILAIGTILAMAGFAIWNLWSVTKQQKYGAATTGVGGPNDPLSGHADLPPSPLIPAEKKG